MFIIDEMFNTSIDVDWHRGDDVDTAMFEYAGCTYKAEIKKIRLAAYKILFVGFAVMRDDSTYSTALQSNSKTPGAILGIVANAVSEYLKSSEWDVLAAGTDAVDPVERKQRMRIYNMLISMFEKKFPNNHINKNVNVGDGEFSFVFNGVKIDNDTLKKVLSSVKIVK